MATVIALPFVILWAVPVVLWQAYVSTILWGWFVVPFGLPVLSMAWAVGLSCLLTAMKPNPYVPSKKDSGIGEAAFCLLCPILNPAVGLLIGWIALHWMPTS